MRRTTPTSSLIVRRGLDPAYYFFTEISARTNGITLIIDRRNYERRIDSRPLDIEHRTNDRRALPPLTWTRDAILVTEKSVP